MWYCYIFYIWDKENGSYKIWKSKNPLKRIPEVIYDKVWIEMAPYWNLDNESHYNVYYIKIIDIIKTYRNDFTCISIDAPIVVNNEKGSRNAEILFMKEKINGFNISLFTASRSFLTSTFGQIRGEILSDKIISNFPEFVLSTSVSENKNIILETFPSGITCGLFSEIYPIKYKLKKKNTYNFYRDEMKKILERFKYVEEVENRVTGLVKELEINDIQITRKIISI